MTELLRILISPVAWLAAFSAVYGLSGLICEIAPAAGTASMTWQRTILVAAFLLAVSLQVALLGALYSTRFGARSAFVRTVSRTSGWVGLVATIWTLFPTLTTSICD